MSNPVHGLVEPSNEIPASFEHRVVEFRHRLADSGTFGDRNLVRILNSHPGDFLDVHSSRSETAVPQSTPDGAELLEAVQSGRASVVIRNVMRFQPGLQRVVERLYAELEGRTPEFVPRRLSASLLISHSAIPVADPLSESPGIAWQVRGRQRLWIADDATGIPSTSFDLQPGDALAWPQDGSLRQEILDGVNVTLCTGHFTPRQLRHARVVGANRWLQRWLKLPCRSTATSGIGYAVKSSVYLGLLAARRCWPPVANAS